MPVTFNEPSIDLFQSTHPLRDATYTSEIQMMSADKFQSTHPLRDATHENNESIKAIIISIHAPLTGCDHSYRQLKTNPKKFQSTHPLRDATNTLFKVRR